MPSTFALAPIPFWIILDANGKPAANCIMYPRSSLDHQLVKNVFQDPAGLIPYPLNADGGIVFNDNGTKGPFYWENTGIANDLYYLEFWTADGTQNLYTIDQYPIAGTGGGGGPITVVQTFNNFVINGQFSYNVLPPGGISPIPPGTIEIQAISPSDNTIPQETQGGWFFIKDLTANTDSLSIVEPSLSSTSPVSNPRGIATYSCTVAGGGSRVDLTYITRDSKSFQNQQIMFQFEAQASGSAPIGVASEVFIRQNFGTGGAPSSETEFTFPFVWPAAFAKVTIPITVPTTAGKSRGTNNDDYFAIGIRMPIGSTGVYQVTNVMGVKGTIIPAEYLYEAQAETYYKIEGSNGIFSTGMMIHRWSNAPIPGWVILDAATKFGSLSSAPATPYRGQLYFNIYTFLWNNLPDSKAPVSGGRGVSALADWNAGKTITPPITADCVFANVGGSGTHTVGDTDGSINKIIAPANLPPLHVSIPYALTGGTFGAGGIGTYNLTSFVNYSVLPSGVSAPFSVLQPTNWAYTFIKL